MAGAEDNCSAATTSADISSSVFVSKADPGTNRIEAEEEPSSACIEEILGDDDVFHRSSSTFSPPEPDSINTVIPSPLDPLAESYRVSCLV